MLIGNTHGRIQCHQEIRDSSPNHVIGIDCGIQRMLTRVVWFVSQSGNTRCRFEYDAIGPDGPQLKMQRQPTMVDETDLSDHIYFSNKRKHVRDNAEVFHAIGSSAPSRYIDMTSNHKICVPSVVHNAHEICGTWRLCPKRLRDCLCLKTDCSQLNFSDQSFFSNVPLSASR